MEQVQEQDLLREVPEALQKLVRFIVRGFYGIEYGLVVDVIVRNTCVKEEDIQALLKFDKKQLRAMLVILKNDKIIKTKLCVETQEGKVLRHNYYYINYRSICNIIKYKLHHIHKRIETQERDLTNRAAFKCQTCQNTYTDLDVNLLMDPFTGTLKCTYCNSEVEEDVSTEAGQDSRTLQAKFNEQMEPVYKMLKDTENIRLSLELLEPEPMFIQHLHPDAKPNAPRSRTAGEKANGGGHWADVKKPGMDYYQDVTINIGDEQPEEKMAPKEVPIWITQSTIGASDATSSAISSISDQTSRFNDNRTPSSSADKKDKDEVLAMLMMQERSSNSHPAASTTSRRHSHDNRSDSDESGGEWKNKSHGDDEDSEDIDDPIVMVAGKQYRYSEVAHKGQSLVQLMTPQEKMAYIEIGQQMYDDMDH